MVSFVLAAAQKVSGVVQEIIGIVVHFRRSQSEIERDNWEMRQSLLRNLERLRNKSIAKVKKNLYIGKFSLFNIHCLLHMVTNKVNSSQKCSASGPADSSLISSRVKPKTLKIGIHSFRVDAQH